MGCDLVPGGDVYAVLLRATGRRCRAGSRWPEGDYPSRSALDAQSEAACLPSFETYVGRDYETSELYVTTFEPTQQGWREGDRGLLCVISTENAEMALTGSVLRPLAQDPTP